MWICMCLRRCAFWRKALAQASHLKGFSPVWVRRCTLMLLLFKKPRLQMLHRCTGFSLPPSDVVMTVVILLLDVLEGEPPLELVRWFLVEGPEACVLCAPEALWLVWCPCDPPGAPPAMTSSRSWWWLVLLTAVLRRAVGKLLEWQLPSGSGPIDCCCCSDVVTWFRDWNVVCGSCCSSLDAAAAIEHDTKLVLLVLPDGPAWSLPAVKRRCNSGMSMDEDSLFFTNELLLLLLLLVDGS